jgi:hypothetical protein
MDLQKAHQLTHLKMIGFFHVAGYRGTHQAPGHDPSRDKLLGITMVLD